MAEKGKFLCLIWLGLGLIVLVHSSKVQDSDVMLDACFKSEEGSKPDVVVATIKEKSSEGEKEKKTSDTLHQNQQLLLKMLANGMGASESDENGIYNGDDDQEENGKFDFSVELFHQLYNEDEETNLFFSPHSIHEALQSAFFGSKKETENQLRKVLHINGSETKSSIYKRAKASRRHLRNSTVNSVDFNSLTRLYFSQDEPVRPCIRSIFGEREEESSVKTSLNSDAGVDANSSSSSANEEGLIEFINFKDSDNATKKINKFVEAETKGKIKELIPPGDLSADSRIALVNTAYFKGTWSQEFDKAATKTSLFHISPDKITQTMMMYLKGNFRHGATESLKSYILDMPYKGNSHSMIILLPPFLPGALNETVSRLNSETLRSSIEELRDSKNSEYSFNDEVEIYFPRFKIEQTFDLTKVLSSLGAKDLFDPERADLSDFSEKQGLSFNSAMHKSFLEVNEEGAEAASATSFITARRGRLHPLTRYVVNRPFIFAIVDNTNRNDLLFMGVFKSPKMTKKAA